MPTNRERRSEVSRAERSLIRETAVLVHEQTYQKLIAEKITRRVLNRVEPVVTRDIRVPYPDLISRPRAWLKELLSTLAAAHFVTIDPVVHRGETGLRLTGKLGDVLIAERTVPRTLVLVRNYADYAYKNRDKIIPGSRKRWLAAFVAYEQHALGETYKALMKEFGYAPLEQLVGGFNHVILSGTAEQLREARQQRRLLAAS